jgi:hypothetical protein
MKKKANGEDAWSDNVHSRKAFIFNFAFHDEKDGGIIKSRLSFDKSAKEG